jgi:hypothetical protein
MRTRMTVAPTMTFGCGINNQPKMTHLSLGKEGSTRPTIFNRFMGNHEIVRASDVRHNRDGSPNVATIFPCVGLVETKNIHLSMFEYLKKTPIYTEYHRIGSPIDDALVVSRTMCMHDAESGETNGANAIDVTIVKRIRAVGTIGIATN